MTEVKRGGVFALDDVVFLGDSCKYIYDQFSRGCFDETEIQLR